MIFSFPTQARVTSHNSSFLDLQLKCCRKQYPSNFWKNALLIVYKVRLFSIFTDLQWCKKCKGEAIIAFKDKECSHQLKEDLQNETKSQYPSRHCTGRLYYVVPNHRNLQIQNNEINKKWKCWMIKTLQMWPWPVRIESSFKLTILFSLHPVLSARKYWEVTSILWFTKTQ